MAGNGLIASDDGGARLSGTPPSGRSGRSRFTFPFRRGKSVRDDAGADPRSNVLAVAVTAEAAARPNSAPATGGVREAAPIKKTAEGAAAPVAVPVREQPRLAEGVELAGEMVESAFKSPPWLISRGGRYVQVSRLLYAVAEQCDGKRSLDEIARAVSDAIKRDVGPDDVKVIVSNLMKSGIIALPDGFKAAPVDSTAGAGPLGLNMKMRMLSPRVIDPMTALIQFLYWPPVLVVALGVAAVAQVWVYLSHGVGEGIHAAFYTPGLMLAVFGFIVLAAAFHELGHAAALRYGGARARAMGVGLYIVYPAFYTDVTENYKLPRWARLRTDLGGFYFNLLFILALLAIYRLTGYEFLILIVVILNLEIVHQLLPFVRLDGYWALADVTGIPDFFSQIVPFLRAHLPRWVPLPEGPKLAELKTWGKFAFAAYILITIPLLLFLLFTMLRAAPRIIATALDALMFQVGIIGKSFGAGDIVIALAAIAQVAALALPLLGIVYTFYTLGRRVFGAIWRWSQPTPARRVTGGVMSAALVAGIALLWAPQLPLPGAPAGPLYAATAPFVPIQRGEQFNLADIAVTQGSLGNPGVTAAPSPSMDGALPAGGAGGAASPQPGASQAPAASSAPAASAPAASAEPVASPTAGSSPAGATPTPCPSPSDSATASPQPSPSSAGACP
jgi:putative peptide zinc metalloprotease protein